MIQEKRFVGSSFINLPTPVVKSEVSLEEALQKRKSRRQYRDEEISLEEVGQLLWSAYGINAPEGGGRTVPSAGAVYPLAVYLVARKVAMIEPGVYRYWPEGHRLSEIVVGTISRQLAGVAMEQSFIEKAGACLVLTANFKAMLDHYGSRGELYIWLEAGHSAQNVYLQVQSLGLGTVAVGAFDEGLVASLLSLPPEERVLYLLPVGKI